MDRRATLLVTAGAVAGAVHVAWVLSGWGGPAVVAIGAGLVTIGAFTVAALACLEARRRATGRARAAWGLFAAAVISWTLGAVVWTAYEVAQPLDVPTPSLADVGFLAFYPLAFAALVGLSFHTTRDPARSGAVFEAVAVGAALVLVSDVLVIEPVLAAGGEFLNVIIAVAYPVGDLAIAILAFRLVTSGPARRRPEFLLVAGGFVALSVADSVYAVGVAEGWYATGRLSDVGWTVGAFLVAGAALVSDSRPVESSRASTGGVFVALVSFALVGIALLVSPPSLGHVEGLVLVSVIVGAWAARHVVSVREAQRLVSELASARDALAEAQRIVHLASWTCDVPNGRLTASLDVHALFGLETTATPVTLGALFERVHPDDREALEATHAKVVAGHGDLSCTFRVVPHAASTRWVQATFRLKREGGDAVIGTALDVTEMHEAIAALRASEARFRQIAENITEVFWMVDAASGEMLYVSPGYERIWGRPCGDLYARPASWMDAIHPEDRERVVTAWADPATFDTEYRIARPDGGMRWIHDRAFPVHDETGSIVRIAGIARDVTEQVRLRAAADANRDAVAQQARLSALGALVAGVAHEINNPLTYVRGNIEVALMDIPADDVATRKGLESALAGALRIEEIVKALKVVAGKGGRRDQRVDLQEVVRGVSSLVKVSVPDSVQVSFETDGPHVVAGDPAELHQMLLNLARNAIQAVEAQGGRVSVRLSAAGGSARFVVEDDGPGLPEAVREKIFTPFLTTKPGGTGLGLPVAQAIVRDHQGTLVLEEAPGVTRFVVTLPLLEKALAPKR